MGIRIAHDGPHIRWPRHPKKTYWEMWITAYEPLSETALATISLSTRFEWTEDEAAAIRVRLERALRVALGTEA